VIGRWSSWYDQIEAGDSPQPYGDTVSYSLGADWLKDCSTVEDWGCGMGWARSLFDPSQYRGLDGSVNPFVDKVVDLTLYRSNPPVPGIFMRHVLEHNWDWERMLDNALASFTQRMALILFTPMAEVTHQIPDMEGCGGINVPAISFRHEDLTARMDGNITVLWNDILSKTWFGGERIYYLEKP